MSDDQLVAERKRKIGELAELGVPAYNVDFSPDTSFAQAGAALVEFEGSLPDEAEHNYDGAPAVKVAGRVMQLRMQGKSCFAHIEDGSERMQVWLRLDHLEDNGFEVVKLLDLGDIIGIEGTLMRTRRGEATVLGRRITMLVKALRPLPEKFHGLQDQETRYRKRYLDLLSNTESRRHFQMRSQMITAIRKTLDERGFLEVETPVLQTIAGGAAARPFITHWNALDTDVFMRISLELHLKRLLVGGIPRVYEIGRIFRNEGLSPRHNPEFTMLEAYQAYGDYNSMRELTEALVVAAAEATPPADGSDPLTRTLGDRELNFHPPFKTARMVDLVEEACDFNVADAWAKGTLADEANKRKVDLRPKLGPGAILLEIYEQKVEPNIWDPTFVLDYPAEVSPLARRRKDDPNFTERFEIVVAGRELANAFSELNDPIDQRARFEDQAAKRQAGDLDANPIDEDFLEAIETGMPPAGGLGVGIDRLAMLLLGSMTIRDVLLFPTMRPTPLESQS